MLKTAHRTPKWTKISGSGLGTYCIQGNFYRQVLRVSLMSFGAFPIVSTFNNRESGKWLP